ncbi:DNA-binding response regulator [bacterium endosymbiont of Escarpia laminata]|nr:MAG: DNA-binding response regulator [bacterium endosymbiont of Escarpia laminata]RLJ19647.1 MAG: DNA-binding response regulator [bacterium endosymbiont of Escarpia laminata]
MRIACLEDDPVQSVVLREWMESEGYVCHVFADASAFIRELRHESYDLLIMDWELPDATGIEVLSWVRKEMDWNIPVLFITHRDSEGDIVEALEQGADDYLAKPISREITLARVKALARRKTGPTSRNDVLEIGNFKLIRDAKMIVSGEVSIELTEKEFQLAWILFSNVGRLLSRDHLLETVWGFGPGLVTRTVDTHMSRLRRKLSLVPENGWRLKAVYHQGYRLEQLQKDDMVPAVTI